MFYAIGMSISLIAKHIFPFYVLQFETKVLNSVSVVGDLLRGGFLVVIVYGQQWFVVCPSSECVPY